MTSHLPPAPQGTDAFDPDADALDRLLDTHATAGQRSTRPTSQVPDHILAMADRASAFHQTVRTAQAHHPTAARPDPQLWETIMSSVQPNTAPAAPVPVATTSATRASLRPAIATGRWGALVTFIVIALVIAGTIATLATSGRLGWFDGPGNDDPATEVAGLQELPAYPGSATPTNEPGCQNASMLPSEPDDINTLNTFLDLVMACVPMYAWPPGLEPNADAIIDHYEPGDTFLPESTHSTLEEFNACAWIAAWLYADGQGDDVAAEAARVILLETLPTFESTHIIGHPKADILDAVSNGYTERTSGLASGCFPIWWASAPVDTATADQETAPVTPAAQSGCPLDRDIPVLLGSQYDWTPHSTMLLLQDDGTLILGCESGQAIIATNVRSAGAFDYPGYVSVTYEPITIDPRRHALINIATGQRFAWGLLPEGFLSSTLHPPGSPWIIAPALNDASRWLVTDLRTLESRDLADYIGGALPEGLIPVASAETRSDTLAIALVHAPVNATPETAFHGIIRFLIVVDTHVDAYRTLAVPDDVDRLAGISLSPGGSQMVLTVADAVERKSDSILISTETGQELARTGLVDGYGSYVRWVQDGATAIVANERAIYALNGARAADPLLLQADLNQSFGILESTPDQNVVVFERWLSAGPDRSPQTESVILNVATGESIAIPGENLLSMYRHDSTGLPVLAMVTPAANGTGYELTFYDATTGAVLTEPFALGQGFYPSQQFTDGSVVISPTGSTVITLPDGTLFILGPSATGMSVTRHDITDFLGIEEQPVHTLISNDGTWIAVYQRETEGTDGPNGLLGLFDLQWKQSDPASSTDVVAFPPDFAPNTSAGLNTYGFVEAP